MCEPGYLAWCQAQGVVVHGVTPALVAAGWRGIVATQPLAAGAAVVEVPEALLLSVLSAARDPQLAAALQQHRQQQQQQQQLSSHQVLALHLLVEASKGAASPWQPYIRQLPQQYTNLAAWPAAAVAALQLPYAQEAAAAARGKARAEWRAARPVLHALGVARKWASWPAWLWASCTLLSRTMFHPGDPECGCLTPLGDLHNYAPPPPPFTPHLARDSARLLLAQQQHQHQQQQQQQQQQQCAGSQAAAQPALADEPQPPPSEEAAPSSSSSSSSSQPGTETADGVLTPASPASVPGDLVASAPLPPPHCLNDDPSDAHQQHWDALVLLAAADEQEQQQQEGPDGSAAASCTDAVCGDGHYDAARGVYSIVARRSYAPGEEVFLCYGRHTNLELLELYGFLLPAAAAAAEASVAAGVVCNPHDAALLPPELLQQQLQAALEAQLARQQQQQQPAWQQQHACQGAAGRRGGAAAAHAWRAIDLQVPPADAFVHACGQPSWQLLSALRLAAAPPALARRQGYRAHEGEPISLDSELLVLTALAGACRAQLAALPTTRQQDAALLAQLLAARCCAETGASASTDGGQGAGSTSLALNKCQEQQQDDRQARLASECLLLAVEWRQTHKACLAACVSHCETALALVARHDGTLV